ncbi:MAG: hypothetical protein JRN35_05870 [Nitrososphaerota archaeon]|nr:hypothetical protein [Nitrososphaerota archaeon]
MVKRVLLAGLAVVVLVLSGCGAPKSAVRATSPASSEKASISSIYNRVASLETYTATISGKVDNQQGLLLQIKQQLDAIQKALDVVQAQVSK